MHLAHHLLFQSCSALILMAAARAADAQNEFPPLEPEAEIIAEGEAFAQDCLMRIMAMSKNLEFKLSGMPVLTRSERWGLIWRVDCEYANLNQPVNRFVCAERGQNGPAIVVAIGQELVPLTQRPLPGILLQ